MKKTSVKENLKQILKEEYNMSEIDIDTVLESNPATIEMIDAKGQDSLYAGAMLLNWKYESDKQQ